MTRAVSKSLLLVLCLHGPTLAGEDQPRDSAHTKWQEVWSRDGGSITNLAVDPAGKLLVTSGPGSVKVLELATGNLFLKLGDKWSSGGVVAFAPDGRLAVYRGGSKTVEIWNLTAKTQLRAIKVGQRPHGLSFDSTGKHLAVSSDQHRVLLFDAKTGRKLRTYQGKGDPKYTLAYGAAFSPDGKLVAAGGWTGELWIWDVSSGRLQHSLQAHTKGAVSGIGFTPDSKQVVTAGFDWRVRVWDAASGKQVKAIRTLHKVQTMVLSRDGKQAVTGQWGGEVCVWDLAQGSLVLKVPVKEMSGAVALSPNGKQLVWQEGLLKSKLRLWSKGAVPAAPKATGPWSGQFEWSGSQLHWSGNRLVYLAAGRGIGTLETESGGQGPWIVKRELLSKDNTYTRWIAGRGDRLVACDDTGAIRVFTGLQGTPREVRTFKHPEGKDGSGGAAALGPKGRWLALRTSEHLELFDTQTGKRKHRIKASFELREKATKLAFDPKGKLLALATRKKLLVYRTDRGALVAEIAAEKLLGIRFLKRGKRLLGVSEAGILQWDLRRRPRPRRPRRLRRGAQQVAFGPAGKRIAVLGKDRKVRVVDLKGKVVLKGLAVGKTSSLSPPGLVFSPDGTRLAVSNPEAGTTRVVALPK